MSAGMRLFFRHTKTDKRYEILGFDKEKGEVRLKSDYAEFEMPYEKAKFEKLGYVFEKERVDDGGNK
jgi:preprotein translocase subunit Sec63